MQTTGHENRILIKTSATTPTIEASDNTLMVGELGYSYAGANSDGGGRLFIGVSLVEGDSEFATAIHEIGGKYYIDMMDHDRGHVVANSVLITDSANKIDFLQVDNLIFDGNIIENDNAGIELDAFGDVTLITNGQGNINVDSNRIVNVLDPINPLDAVNKRFFEDAVTNVRADNRQSQWNVFDANDELHLIGGKNITTFMEVPNAGNLDVTINLDDSIDGLTSLTIDNIKIDGNTISTTTGSLILDPNPDGSNGTLVVQGDLQVQGTTTTINSTELNINDKNITLADGAADSAQADGGGITLDGANATIIYDASTDQWVFNKDISAPNLDVDGDFTAGTITGKYLGFDSDFAAKSTTDLSEGTNLYYTTARADSDFDVRFTTKTTDDLTEGSTNLYYTAARFDSGFSTKTTTDLAEGDNLYYTTARADSDARSALSVANPSGFGTLAYDSATGKFTFTGVSTTQIRSQFSAGGDITYDSAAGKFSLDVEVVYTADNFDSDFRDRLLVTTTDSVAEGNNNLYYTTARADSDARHAISVVDGGGPGSLDYNNNTGVITYIGPSPAELASNVRPQFSAEGDLNYDQVTGVFSIDVESAYTQTNFDSDLGQATTDLLPEGNNNLYYTQARFDSALGDKTTNDVTEGTNLYFTDERVDDRVNDLLIAGQAIDIVYSDILNQMTIAAEIATTTNFGVSRYDSIDFAVTAGMVEINTIDCGTY